MTEPLKTLRVTCHFCGHVVLPLTCDKVKIRKVINTQPKIVRETEVNRCIDCKARRCGE